MTEKLLEILDAVVSLAWIGILLMDALCNDATGAFWQQG